MLYPSNMNYEMGDVLIGTPAASQEYRVTTEGSVIIYLEDGRGFGRFTGWHIGNIHDTDIIRKTRDAKLLLTNTTLEELPLWTASIHQLVLRSGNRIYFRPQFKRLENDLIKYSSRLPDL